MEGSAASEEPQFSISGSSGGASARTATAAKQATRTVPAKYLQAPSGAGFRQDVGMRESNLRRGSLVLGPVASTPAPGLLGGRSMNLPSAFPASGAATSRSKPVRDFSPSTSMAPSSFSAAPSYPSDAMTAAAQEDLKAKLARWREEKEQKSAAQVGPGPRVPPLALGALRSNAQAQGDGSRTARGAAPSGVGGAPAGPSSARAPLSARAASGHMRPPAAPGGLGSSGRFSAATAKAPPVPRGSTPAMRAAEQQLQTALHAPLPRDETWEAAQGVDDGAAHPTPSSRITKSPMRGVSAGGAGLPPMAAPPFQARSPPPVSARGPRPAENMGASLTAGQTDGLTARTASNADTSTSDAGQMPIKDQVKYTRLQGLMWASLESKVAASSKARLEQGERELAAVACMIQDLYAQSALNEGKLAAIAVQQRVKEILETQLPLLEEWSKVQGTHVPATQQVLVALQNAMTSLPLVNGAALGGWKGPGGGGMADPPLAQLQASLTAAFTALQGAETALNVLVRGSAGVGMVGSSELAASTASGAGGGSGGVPVMASLLPRLQQTLTAEVSALRSLLGNMNQLARKMAEIASLRVTLSSQSAKAPAGLQGARSGGAPSALSPGDCMGSDQRSGGAVEKGIAEMDIALAQLGLGAGFA